MKKLLKKIYNIMLCMTCKINPCFGYYMRNRCCECKNGGNEMNKEYNLINPSVLEEERMIQDRIDEEYDAREAYDAYCRAMEEYYHKQMEELK